MAAPLQVAQSVVDTVPTLTTLQRLRIEIWQCSNRFVVRDTIRAVLARDTDIDPTVYTLLTAAWRDRFPGFDA